MAIYNVISARILNNQVIVHEVDTGKDTIQTLKYSAVRAGLSWPTPSSPAYFIVLGEEYIMEDAEHYDDESHSNQPRGKLRLFSEHEFSGLSLVDFFTRLTVKLSGRLVCQE